MPRPGTENGAQQWLVSCSLARTLIARRDDAGRTVVVKLFQTGTLADAQREVDFGNLLSGQGVVHHQAARVDRQTGKPSVVMEFVRGVDLQAWVGRHGPMTARTAARVGLQLARAVRRFAEHRSTFAPHGVVHRDIKPSNVLIVEAAGATEEDSVMLLDLEHAVVVAPQSACAAFTGGTHGFAPPEAYDGHTPDPAFDVFGFGCTFHFLLSGCEPFMGRDDLEIGGAVCAGVRRREHLSGCPRALRELIDACLSAEPSARPTPAEIVARLEAWQPEEAAATERARLAILAGDFERATAACDALGAEPGELRRLLHRRRRLLERVGEPAPFDDAAPTHVLATDLADEASGLSAFLKRFPAHPRALDLRAQLLQTAARLVRDVPVAVAELKRAARFAAAERLISDTLDALTESSRLGRIPPSRPDAELPQPIERDPARFLRLAQKDVAAADEAHAALLARLEGAEAAIDLASAEEVLGEFATLYGGASEIVAKLKDRLHRLEFYLARISHQKPSVTELGRLVEATRIPVDLRPLTEFLDACTSYVDTDSRVEATTENLRVLQRSVQDLCREYPHIESVAAHGREALESALGALTSHAWDMLADSKHKLTTPPIPIRPLQSILGRLDDLRVLEVPIDLPDRPRTALLDEIETLRLQLEQARATRDRIARGAQQAMDRGHLTTALYDMARAVNQFGDEPNQDGPVQVGSRLAQQFEEAKRRKQAIDDALRDNHRLARRYAEISADEDSLPADGLMVLQEREHVLSFLCTNLGPERTALYSQDLREVQFRILSERAREGEQMLAAGGSVDHQLAVAQQTYDALQLCAPEHGWDPAHISEASEILQHWRDRLEGIERKVSARAESDRRAAERRGRERWLRRGLAAAVVVAGVLGLYSVSLAGGEDGAELAVRLEQRLGRDPGLTFANGRPHVDGAREIAALTAFVSELGAQGGPAAEIARPSEALAARVAEAGRSGDLPLEQWLPRFTVAVAEFDRALAGLAAGSDLRAAFLHFGRRAHRAGFVLASERGDSPLLDRHLERTSDVSIALPPEVRDLPR